jgi:HAD superfamily hydrolase (TIGR01509 family)
VEQQYELALGCPLPADFVGRFGAALKQRFARELRPISGVEAVLAEMRGCFCVASSSDFDRLSFSLAVTRLAPYFGDRVYSSDAVARGKPEPDLFLHAAERMGCAPARSLVIEDSVHGVLAGKAAGMTVWGFVGGSHNAGRGSGAMLADAGADRILHDMAELRSI